MAQVCDVSAMSENQKQKQQTWRVPKIAQCRAARFGQNIVYCLVEDAATCGFSLRFGTSFLCLHPKKAEIVTRTSQHWAVR